MSVELPCLIKQVGRDKIYKISPTDCWGIPSEEEYIFPKHFRLCTICLGTRTGRILLL